MRVAEDSEQKSPRLNPFAFPSDLDLRFALLVVLILSASVFLYDGVWISWPGHGTWFTTAAQTCLAIPGGSLPTPGEISADSQGLAADRISAYSQALNECERPIRQAIALWIVGGLIILLLVALAMFWAFPAWTIRRNRLIPLDPEDGPELSAELASLCREAGLPTMPTFLAEPLNRGVSGLAFGRLGRYYVSLSGGLVVTYYRDVAVFRAVIRHELAHLHNHDVDKTYFVVAIWWAFLAVAALPFAITLLRSDLGWAFALAWRGAVLALVVYLTRNAVLRAREVYADLRASIWDGPAGALRRVVGALPSPAPGRWRFLWQLHPRPTERRRFIDETDDLFRAKFWDAVGAGLAISIAFTSLDILAFQLLGGLGDVATSWWLATLAVAPLGVGVVGVGVWRETFAGLVRDRSARMVWRLGLGLGIGVVLGQILAFPAAVDTLGPGGQSEAPPVLWAAQGLWDLVLVLGLVVFVWWLAVGAALWLSTLDGASGSRRTMLVGLVLGGYLLTWWYGLLVGTESVASAALAQMSSLNGILLAAAIPVAYWVIVLAQSPLTLLAATIFWSFPLIAGLRRSPEATPERAWAFLDSVPVSRPCRVVMPRVGSALAIGLRSGLVYAALLLIGRIAYRLGVPEAVRNQDDVILAFFWSQVALAVLVAAIAAGVAAGRPHPLGILHGLAGASAAATSSAIALLALNLVFGGHAEPQFVWMTFSQVVNESTLVALPVALVRARGTRRRRDGVVGDDIPKVEGRAVRAP
jgi:Zn-dependent protease with chaperone function